MRFLGNALSCQKISGNRKEMNSIFSPKDDEALKKQELIQEHNMKEDEIRKQVKTSMKKPTGLFL